MREPLGASSTTTCALVPPTPNELTPARRTPSHSQGPYLLCTMNGLVETQFRVGAGVVQCRGNRLVLQAQNRFDETRHTGGDFQVTDVRLDRSENTRSGPGRLGYPERVRSPWISI